jgi:Ulp1 family protease
MGHLYPGIQPPAYLLCVDKTAPQQTNGHDCGIFMLANLMARIEGHEHCGYIDARRVRA